MDDLKLKSYIEQMTINVVKYLQNKNGICQVKNDIKFPSEKPAVLMWEQKNSLLLPEDLKSFYLTSNGFHLTWSVQIDGKESTVPVGRMHINTVATLTKLDNGTREGTHVVPSLWDLDLSDEPTNGRRPPSFCDSKIYELDACDGIGKVCLVFNEVGQGGPDSESDSDASDSDFDITHDFVTSIWFLDRSLHWHFLCNSFLSYYRLMLMHLGLPQWQFAFTDIGLPQQSKQWFNMYAPIRLEVDEEGTVEHTSQQEQMVQVSSSPLDLNKVFKGKSDRKKIQGNQNQIANASNNATAANTKRKPPVSSARSATSLGKPGGAPNSQMAVKTSR